jgi:hypothetical protein
VYAPVSPTANVARIRTLALPDTENIAVGDAGMYAGVSASSSVCRGILVRRASGGRILLLALRWLWMETQLIFMRVT